MRGGGDRWEGRGRAGGRRSLTQGQCVGALGGDGEGDDEVGAGRVAVDEGGAVGPQPQHAAQNLHHLGGVAHRPAGAQSEFKPTHNDSLGHCDVTKGTDTSCLGRSSMAAVSAGSRNKQKAKHAVEVIYVYIYIIYTLTL